MKYPLRASLFLGPPPNLIETPMILPSPICSKEEPPICARAMPEYMPIKYKDASAFTTQGHSHRRSSGIERGPRGGVAVAHRNPRGCGRGPAPERTASLCGNYAGRKDVSHMISFCGKREVSGILDIPYSVSPRTPRERERSSRRPSRRLG